MNADKLYLQPYTEICYLAVTTWLDLIHTWLDLIHTWLDLIHTWLDLIHTWLDLIVDEI